jgi:mannose-1-phosphate guanylyltransferase
VNLKGPLYIGSSSSIGDGVSITGPAMIGANCEIGSGAQISEGIVSDYTRVDGNASLEQCIIFAGRCINPDGSVLDLEEAGMTWLIDDSRKKSVLDEESAALRELLANITPPERKIA